MVLSEHTKHMDIGEIEQTKNDVAKMNKSELADYLKSLEPDMMGFCGKEGVDENED